MPAIRLTKKQRSKAWRAMIAIGPITRVTKELLYHVSPAHVELLNALGISYEILNGKRKEKKPRASSRIKC